MLQLKKSIEEQLKDFEKVVQFTEENQDIVNLLNIEALKNKNLYFFEIPSDIDPSILNDL